MTQSTDFGSATIEPTDDVVAASFGTWRLTYLCGSIEIAVGGSVRIHTDSDTDWEYPQFTDPSAADFMTVESPAGVQTAVRVENQRSLRAFIHGRNLRSGEELTFIFGDNRFGSPGSRAQTFAEENRLFWIEVDAVGDGNSVALDSRPSLSIVGGDVKRLIVTGPSTVVVGQPFRVLLKAEDEWGNPCRNFDGQVDISSDGIDIAGNQHQVNFADSSSGACWIDGFIASQTGVFEIKATLASTDETFRSNPIEVHQGPLKHELCWSDSHGGQLVLNSKFGDFFRYARDVAGLQFVGFQRNADVISTEDWEIQQQQEREFHEPGRFIPIPGFEWSGRTWEGGHHNIYFRRHDQPARRNLPAETMFQSNRVVSELSDIQDVYRAYRGTDVIITPHVGGEHSDITHHEPTLEPAVEIVSSHGMFEWMQRDALRRGYKLGFLGGSDSYTCRPGDDRPGFQMRRYSKAGVTGIYCEDVSLASFFAAMRARRVFATTGARMILRLESDGHLMGSEYTTREAPSIRASVTGTAALESVELFRGLERIYSAPVSVSRDSKRVRILWSGSSRMTSYSGIVWDGIVGIKNGRILSVETRRFDSPRSHIVEQSDETVRWHAWGCGYPMALILEIEDPDNAELTVAVDTQTITGPAYGQHGSEAPRRISLAPAEKASISVRVADLIESEPRTLPIGVLDRKLQVELEPQCTQSSVEVQFTDDNPQPGMNPYWIRAIQTDLEYGWSSPVFVDYCPPTAGT